VQQDATALQLHWKATICPAAAAWRACVVCRVMLAVPSGSTVTVTCSFEETPSSFVITLNATTSNGGCSADGSITTPVTIISEPIVTVAPPAGKNPSVCIGPNADNSTDLVFTVSSPDVAAIVSVTVTAGAATCTPLPSTVSKCHTRHLLVTSHSPALLLLIIVLPSCR
jgi:hypothetical protein